MFSNYKDSTFTQEYFANLFYTDYELNLIVHGMM